MSDRNVDHEMQVMTSLHFALSSARASTVGESVGRAAMYLTTVSMSLVALGFISAATRMDQAFYVFAFVLLACLILLGVISFFRVVQTGVEDMKLSRDERRIHAFYVDAAPGVERWFNPARTDDEAMRQRGMSGGSPLQMLLTVGSMVGGVNSAVMGVFVGLAVARFGGGSLAWATGAGALIFALAFGLHLRRQYAMFGPGDRFGGGSDPAIQDDRAR